MTDLDKKRFAATMGTLGVAFDTVPTKQRMAIYFDALVDLQIEAVEWAAREAVRRLVFFPKAKELRDLAMMAPRQKRSAIAAGDARPLLQELEPAEVVAQRLADVADQLNRQFGTKFRVDQEKGRPVLLAGEVRANA